MWVLPYVGTPVLDSPLILNLVESAIYAVMDLLRLGRSGGKVYPDLRLPF